MTDQTSAFTSPSLNLPFTPISPWLGIGDPCPHDWRTIAELPLVILVGVTAAGKNTATAAMQKAAIKFALLPNRRELSDRVTIPLSMETYPNPNLEQIKRLDRVERLRHTRQFRDKYPGGMAQLLTKMSVDASQVPALVVFDGLRGAAEVGYAASNLPQAKFIVLEATDLVRLLRLLTRNDPFDRAAQDLANSLTNLDLPTSFASLGIADAALFFTPEQEQEIFNRLHNGQIELNQLRDKLKIIIAERQNYDPMAARDTLMAIAPERSLFIDTAATPPERIAVMVKQYLS
jgi:hypothetical protein